MKLLVIGCGGVAQVAIQKCAQVDDVFTDILIASRTESKCKDLVAKIKDKTKAKLTTATVNADNVEELVALIESFRPVAVLTGESERGGQLKHMKKNSLSRLQINERGEYKKGNLHALVRYGNFLNLE